MSTVGATTPDGDGQLKLPSANSSTSPGFTRIKYARAAHAWDDLFDSLAERPSRRPRTDPPPLEEEDDNNLKDYCLEGVTTFNIQVNKLFSDYKKDEIGNHIQSLQEDDDLDFDDDWLFNPISYSHQCSLSMVLETTHVKTIYLSRQKSMKMIRRTFKEGIIPALCQGFGVQPRDFPLCYRKWHYVVKGFITSKLFEPGLAPHDVSVGYDDEQIRVFFHWESHH